MTTTTIINKLFLHVSGYDEAPEFSVNDEGVVRIDDEVVEDPALIVKALADNAKAWAKCVGDLEPAPPVTGKLAEHVETVVQQMTAIEVRGPWPRPAAVDAELDLSDERIAEIEGGAGVVG